VVKNVIAKELLYPSSGTLKTCLAYTQTTFNSKHIHVHAIPKACYTPHYQAMEQPYCSHTQLRESCVNMYYHLSITQEKVKDKNCGK
jgi:hypothetical protein